MNNIVYVIERGVYSERYISSVHATLEGAMKEHPSPNGWKQIDNNTWENKLEPQEELRGSEVTIHKFNLKDKITFSLSSDDLAIILLKETIESLRSTINAEGAIKPENIGSAAKRVKGQIFSRLIQLGSIE